VKICFLPVKKTKWQKTEKCRWWRLFYSAVDRHNNDKLCITYRKYINKLDIIIYNTAKQVTPTMDGNVIYCNFFKKKNDIYVQHCDSTLVIKPFIQILSGSSVRTRLYTNERPVPTVIKHNINIILCRYTDCFRLSDTILMVGTVGVTRGPSAAEVLLRINNFLHANRAVSILSTYHPCCSFSIWYCIL
jgi:hypothetical protein